MINILNVDHINFMTTIKSYTDISQSKKLAEILPIESADMRYDGVMQELGIPKVNYNGLGTPCWSLSALLGVLPQSITKYIESEMCTKTFHLNLFRSYYYCCSYSFSPSISDDDGNNTLYCTGKDNWIDACVAMIENLHELKML